MNKQFIKFFILVIVLILIWYLGGRFPLDAQRLEDSLKSLPILYSGLLYVILYAVITFFVFFSKDLFYILGAVLFGAYLSALFIFIAEIINAFVLFHFAKMLGRAYIEKSFKKDNNNLDERLGRINFFWLFLLRATPFVPYRFLDLSAGLSKINFKKYLAAVILGSPLKLFWIQYILSGVGRGVLNDPSALMEYFLHNKVLLVFSLIYLVVAVAIIGKLNSERRKRW
ncbi:MAG: VTT domain-containing protein [Candidatus Omnitrophota bacterium]